MIEIMVNKEKVVCKLKGNVDVVQLEAFGCVRGIYMSLLSKNKEAAEHFKTLCVNHIDECFKSEKELEKGIQEMKTKIMSEILDDIIKEWEQKLQEGK